jgi:hypothetical protein
LYLADGPWGLDYSKTETTISSFMIDNIQILALQTINMRLKEMPQLVVVFTGR